jgi:hypothetical protein
VAGVCPCRENYLAMVVFKHRRSFDEVQTTIQTTESSLSTRIWCQTKAKKNSALAKHAMFSSISKLYHTCNTNHISPQFGQKIRRNYESPIWFRNLHHTNLSIKFACDSIKSNEHEMVQILG